MTQDKIIAAAREAGFGNYAYEAQSMFERFYAIAYRAGMERAAEICKKELNYPNEQAGIDMALWNAIDAIRAESHAKNQTKGRETNG